MDKEIFTFARICVEMDLSKGLSEDILLSHKDLKWTQDLDFENTALRCRVCHQTGHLQSSCIQSKKRTNRKPQNKKGWQFADPLSSEDEGEEMEETIQRMEVENEHSNLEKSAEDVEEQIFSVGDPNTNSVSATPNILIEGNENIQTLVGSKCSHISESSDSDKDVPNAICNNVLALFLSFFILWTRKKFIRKRGKKRSFWLLSLCNFIFLSFLSSFATWRGSR